MADEITTECFLSYLRLIDLRLFKINKTYKIKMIANSNETHNRKNITFYEIVVVLYYIKMLTVKILEISM